MILVSLVLVFATCSIGCRAANPYGAQQQQPILQSGVFGGQQGILGGQQGILGGQQGVLGGQQGVLGGQQGLFGGQGIFGGGQQPSVGQNLPQIGQNLGRRFMDLVVNRGLNNVLNLVL